MAKYCRHFLVSGLVQGVFYRATTVEQASRLGLTGWVRNLADSRVELVACGDAEQVAALEKWLWDGPAHAQVDDVFATDAEDEGFVRFGVR